MLLSSVVETSRRVADTAKRLEKIDLLAQLLRQLHGDEIEIVVVYLSGQTRQGRIGVGYAALRDARHSPAASPTIEILDLDRILQNITRPAAAAPSAGVWSFCRICSRKPLKPNSNFSAAW